MSYGKRRLRSVFIHMAVGLATILGLGSAFGDDADSTPRDTYNAALDALGAEELEAAEAGFLDARGRAGQDAELRYRTAFNLGMTYAAKADAVGPAPTEDPEQAKQAIELLRKSADWFRDASRARPDDEDARVNLELVRRRIQQLADALNKGDETLEKRLDALIQSQRGIREAIRALTNGVEAASATAEPVAFREQFRGVAGQQRTLLADASAVAELAGEELGHLQGIPDDEQTDEQRIRAIQLEALTTYLERGRGLMSDTRRTLRKLHGEEAHRKSDAAVRTLKRAREQLVDPITVLKAVAGDEVMLWKQTVAMERLRSGPIRLQGKEAVAPPWLNATYLSEQQVDARQRLNEITARLQAAVAASNQPGAEQAPAPAPQDPRQARVLQAAEEAIPHLLEANDAMDAVITSLQQDRVSEAVTSQQRALEALARAVERFAEIRDLIELMYAEQTHLVGLLTPPDEAQPAPNHLAGQQDAPEPATPEERATQVSEGLRHNRDRAVRLAGLFDDEVAALQAQQQEAQAQAQAGTPQPPADEDPIALELQRYQMAEAQRVRVEGTLAELDAALAAMQRSPVQLAPQPPVEDSQLAPLVTPDGQGTTLLAPPVQAPSREDLAGAARGAAERAEEEIESLRLLFLSTIEHLKELARRQGDTLDETASLHGNLPDDEVEQMAATGPLADDQGQHELVATALAEALRKQADEAGAGGQTAGGDPAKTAEALTAAAAEVDAAASAMRSATGALAQAPLDLDLALDQEREALQHMLTAIQILEPQSQPPQEPQDQEEEQQDQMSPEQAERKLQEVREREAERRRDRRPQTGRDETVEKDW